MRAFRLAAPLLFTAAAFTAAAATTVFEGGPGAVSSVLPTDDGGTLLAGTLEGARDGSRTWVARIDAAGSVAWQHVVAAQDPSTATTFDGHADVRLVREADGGLLVTASLTSSQFVCAVPEAGLVQRLADDGTLRDGRRLWSLVAIGSGLVDASGASLVAGDFHSIGVGTIPPALTIARLPAGSGDALDARSLDVPGGLSRALAACVHGGGLALAGEIAATDVRGPLVATVDASGSLRSCRVVEAAWPGSGGLHVATAILAAADGGLVVAGGDAGGARPAFVARIDAGGALQWARTTSVPASPHVLLDDGAGGAIVLGEGIALRVSAAGDEVWTRDLGDARVLAAARRADGTLVLGGALGPGATTPFVTDAGAQLDPDDLGCIVVLDAPPALRDLAAALRPVAATLAPIDRTASALETLPAWQAAVPTECVAPPPEMTGLRMARQADRLSVGWDVAGAALHDVFEADLGAARAAGARPSFVPAACDVASPPVALPLAGRPAIAGFLVRGRSGAVAGPLGFGSDGAETVPARECP